MDSKRPQTDLCSSATTTTVRTEREMKRNGGNGECRARRKRAGGIETIRKLFPNWHSEVIIHQNEPQPSHDPRDDEKLLLRGREGGANKYGNYVLCAPIPTPPTSSAQHFTAHTEIQAFYGTDRLALLKAAIILTDKHCTVVHSIDTLRLEIN